jgi:energy-coupling factor transporter ATP-binding protein EcfA2
MISKKTPSTNKIKRIDVDGLFGVHSYSITLPSDSGFSLLIGPNGIGKTTILKMAEFLVDPFDASPLSIFQTQFRALKLTFEDGKSISAKKEGRYSKRQKIRFCLLSSPDASELSSVNKLSDFLLKRNISKAGKTAKINKGFLEFFQNFIYVFGDTDSLYIYHWLSNFSLTESNAFTVLGTYVYRHETCRFFSAEHIDDACFLSFSFKRYASYIENGYSCPDFRPRFSYLKMHLSGREYGKELCLFQKQFCFSLDFLEKVYSHYLSIAGRWHGWPETFLTNHNRTLLSQIKNQNLAFFCGKNFPGLGDIDGLFSIDHQTKIGTIDDYLGSGFSDQTSVLEHMKVEAGGFQDFLEVMDRFSEACKDMIASVSKMGLGRVSKTLSFTKNGTFVFKPVEGRSFGFSGLSTGEKNYVALLFSVIFESMFLSMRKRQSIFLIDEPEISMHVGMQEDFSAKLQRICAETGCQIICATHSPYMAVGDPNLFAKLDYHFPEGQKK